MSSIHRPNVSLLQRIDNAATVAAELQEGSDMSTGIPCLDGTISIVTGGASGIGFAIAEELIAEGSTVVMADVEAAALARAGAALGVDTVLADVSSADDVQRVADEVVRWHGRIDIAVNNAGIARVAPFDELTLDDFRWVLDVNLWGVIHGMKSFLPVIEQTSQRGYIVNTASIAGLRTAAGLGAYAVSKFGVVALTETVGMELDARGSHVGVGVLLPSMVRSNIAASERNRPGAVPRGAGGSGASTRVPVAAMGADVVGRLVVAAIKRGERYIVSHPETLESVRARHRGIEDAYAVFPYNQE